MRSGWIGTDINAGISQGGEVSTLMEEAKSRWQEPRSWIGLIVIVILIIFLLFYRPFEQYLLDNIPRIHFSNILFWFASLVAIVSFAVSHWASFRKSIFQGVAESNAQDLVFDTLQIAVLVAVILCAGATIQAVEMLGVHLMNDGSVVDAEFGRRLLSVFLLVVLAVLFYLLHRVVRGFRLGWQHRWTPPKATR